MSEEKNFFVHESSYVDDGVTIGEGAVIGSNAFVNRDVESWGIYVGSPAKKIGEREKPTDERRAIIEAMDWSNHL